VTPPSSALTIVTKQPTVLSLISPTATINGYPVNLNWGSNTVGMPPGVHHIAIHMPWLWKFGRAEITVDNSGGRAPVVYYASPWVNFGPGAIGLAPVSNPGLAAFIGVLVVVPLLLIAICCGMAAVAGG
jgi:hypothetical protein